MRGEFKDAKKAAGLITARPRRWADRYGVDPNPSKPYRANLTELEAEDWDEAYWMLIQHQCLGDLDGDFDDEESEELCQIQHDEAKEHFETHGFVECNVYNSLSSVIVYLV
jgi:hypothetical protein